MNQFEEKQEIHIKIAEDKPSTSTSLVAGVAVDETCPDLGEKFEVVSLVGSGGMSDVYKVQDKVSKEFFVVKVLKGSLLSDDIARRRFLQETELVKQLNHKNIIEVHASGVTPGGAPYLVMKWLEGMTLADHIKLNGPLPEKEASSLFLQICEALCYAHGKGIIHRDIKPSNILLVGKEKGYLPLLMDFGIAKILGVEGDHNQTQAGSVLGSPAYMSPEQCLGDDIDARSDIYSMGCVMLETLSGKNPFMASTPVATILKHLETDPDLIVSEAFATSKISDHLEGTVRKCLAKRPSLRFQDANSLLQSIYPPARLMPRFIALAIDLPLVILLSAIVDGFLPEHLRGIAGQCYPMHWKGYCLGYFLYVLTFETFLRATPGALVTNLRIANRQGGRASVASIAARAALTCALLMAALVLGCDSGASEAIDGVFNSHHSLVSKFANWAKVFGFFYLCYVWVFVFGKNDQWGVDSWLDRRVVHREASKLRTSAKPASRTWLRQFGVILASVGIVCSLPHYHEFIQETAWGNPAITKDMVVTARRDVAEGQIFAEQDLILSPALRSNYFDDDDRVNKISDVVGKTSKRGQSEGADVNYSALGPAETNYLTAPRSVAYCVQKAHESERERDSAAAEEWYQRALKTNPDDREALLGLASIFDSRKLTQKAANCRKKAAEVQPLSGAKLAQLLNEGKKYAEAAAVCNYNLRTNPADAACLEELARAYQGKSNTILAERTFRALLAVSPHHSKALSFFAERCLARGEYNEAKRMAELAVKADEKNSKAWLTLNQALELLNENDAAEAASRKYQELEGIEEQEVPSEDGTTKPAASDHK